MEVTPIILLIIFILAVTLLFLEVFVIPGTTFFGIAGGIMLVAGIYYTYTLYGNIYGHLSICGAIMAFLLLFVLGKRYMNNSAMTLNENIVAKVNQLEYNVSIGNIGIVHTVLRPNGKAIFDGKKMEVYSIGDFIDKDTKVEIINIEQNKIIVKPLNT